MKTLYLIPARGGSKGIPRKNIRPLGGKPLILYSVDIARQLTSDEHICVSTDDEEIVSIVERVGLKVPFIRPASLALDTTPTYEVILHALNFYHSKGIKYDIVVLLQPTSPFRRSHHILEAIGLFSQDIDMVVSVFETKSNPYYVLFEENSEGFLVKSKQANFTRRQDCPKVYEFNGSIYVMNTASLLKKNLQQFDRIRKYEMERVYSVDLDDELDWAFAEFLLQNRMIP
ncbi:MAG: acylneuraminate cytidylyltransferase family protein [Bacteroidales bacterium]|nr:acylneuraminate cytidylyltransferase family protein [Bacteroidales bacterium]